MENKYDAHIIITLIITFIVTLFGILWISGTLLGVWDRFWYGIIRKLYCKYFIYKYMYNDNLTPVSKRRLTLVKKKTLILDMDETLITSVMIKEDGTPPPTKKCKSKNVPCDFEFLLQDDTRVKVYKRPFMDYFLDRVSVWYDIIIFTAGTEAYATPILDYLDGGRNILTQRLFRDSCVNVYGFNAKFVSLVCPDMANVILLDNSISECSFNVNNAIPITDYVIGDWDNKLLNILPFLDALRFVQDVRSILKRCKVLNAPSSFIDL
ncbi:CTD nuclear envelope phosphatase 1 homolog [Drosophila subobscura]|uniref:CTD nuclear envelope phosphatase 1 homolog n=1 Tax=Drosophila subobscura TaxID=7241 RepID=UPI00155A4F97|nr:CTD nuclear envelope phosphatase 1 homolog [Drosophila subobscura]